MYIDGFDDIVGIASLENQLLQFALDSSYNYLALYSLQALNLSNVNTANKVASFIKRARENYGVQYVGAVVESFSSIQNKIAPYNLNRTDDNEKFNVFNLEFEFWTTSSVNPGGYYCTQYLLPNNCSCDSSGGFKFFIDQLHKIDSVANQQQVLSETYLGWFNQGQGQQIAQNADRVLLHAYRVDETSVYGYSKNRLSYLASNNTSLVVAAIFSAEPNFMGPWLASHTQLDAYTRYGADFAADNSSWKQYIDLQGYHWFDWGYMPKPALVTTGPVINASGTTTFCTGNSVLLTATAGNSYHWSSGETTQSILVSSSGSFSCNVTTNGNTATTPSVTVSVKNLPTVSISEGSSLTGQVPLTAIATAGSGALATYQWKLNNLPISNATASNHMAVESGSYSVYVSNSYGCGTTSAALAVNVSGTACSPTIPNGLSSSATSSPTSFTLHWASGQSGDSIIIRYHPDNLSTYDYIRLSNSGQTSYQLTDLLPNTTYSWRIKSVCGNSSSAYSSKEYFTTGTAGGVSSLPMVSTGNGSAVLFALKLFPNPSQERLQIGFESLMDALLEINITDLSGKIIYKETVQGSQGENLFQLNTNELANGIYIVRILSSNSILTDRLIVEH